MKIYLQQTIQIRMIKIGGISNSSVFQIGSAGIIKPASYLYNTGGFMRPAPQIRPGAVSEAPPQTTSLVPFQTSPGPR
ncbi:MAG: spore germination protein GerPB [Heyndrickxia sp.]